MSIILEHVSKAFGERQVLRDVSLMLPEQRGGLLFRSLRVRQNDADASDLRLG